MIAEVPVDSINMYRLFLLPRIGCVAEDTQRHKGGAQTGCLQATHGGAGDPQSAYAQFQEDVDGVQEIIMEGEEDRY